MTFVVIIYTEIETNIEKSHDIYFMHYVMTRLLSTTVLRGNMSLNRLLSTQCTGFSPDCSVLLNVGNMSLNR